MKLKKIRISNFKSFDEAEIELGDFNVIAGSVASGKSCFIRGLKFINDIVTHGLDSAVSMHGGTEFLRNVNIGPDKNLSIELVFSVEQKSFIGKKTNPYISIMDITEISYRFALEFKKRGPGFDVIEDTIALKSTISPHSDFNNNNPESGHKWEGIITVSNEKGKLVINASPSEKGFFILKDILPQNFIDENIYSPKKLLIEYPQIFSSILNDSFIHFFRDIRPYDFNQRLPKISTLIKTGFELDDDGGNLAAIIKRNITDKNRNRKLNSAIKEYHDYFDDIDIEWIYDGTLILAIKEGFSKDVYMPASRMSDGCISLMMILQVLYMEKHLISIFKEPERHFHAGLIKRILASMKKVSENRQIIITTCNSSVVKNCLAEDIIHVYRKPDGFSTLKKVKDLDSILEKLE